METSYKEKYEQALAHAREIHRNEDEKRRDMEFIFPELKKSEDEKIRKRLITDFGTIGKKEWGGLEVKDILAWLEKQGEHANFRNKIQVGDKVTRNEDGVLVNLSQLKRVAKPSEKQGEQKASCTTIMETGDGGINALVTLPIEMKTAEESLGIDSDTYDKIVDECIFGEQKPTEWSEEDEVKINRIVACLENLNVADNDILLKDIDWLKSIKDRVQPKQEWSEDDKRKIDRIYSILRQAADTHAFSTSCRLIGDKECMELQDWLKSLRPKNRWKPSELQLECLSDAIEYYNSSGYPAPKLKELYEQLKKL